MKKKKVLENDEYVSTNEGYEIDDAFLDVVKVKKGEKAKPKSTPEDKEKVAETEVKEPIKEMKKETKKEKTENSKKSQNQPKKNIQTSSKNKEKTNKKESKTNNIEQKNVEQNKEEVKRKIEDIEAIALKRKDLTIEDELNEAKAKIVEKAKGSQVNDIKETKIEKKVDLNKLDDTFEIKDDILKKRIDKNIDDYDKPLKENVDDEDLIPLNSLKKEETKEIKLEDIEDVDNLFSEIEDSDNQEEIVNKKEEDKKINKKVEKEKKKNQKSKFSIFILLITLIVIVAYLTNICLNTDFNNLNILELLKNNSFILISLLVVLILLKVNTKKTTPYVFILSLLLTGYIFMQVSTSYSMTNNNYVLDFVNKNIAEVMDWAEKNNIELEILHEFSDTIPKNYVILQEYKESTKISEIDDTFTITISDGPNYDKVITIPNLTGFTFDEVMAFIKENNLSNVEVEFIKSDITRDTVIEQVGSGTLKRNDKIVFKFSYGPDELEPIAVKDLKNLSEFEATAYLKRYNIPYDIKYEYSKTVLKGYVIGQDIVDKVVDDKLTLTVSKGNTVTAPDFLKMTSSEISKWATENNITVNFKEEYNKNYKAGKVINSSVDAGEIIDENMEVTVTISKGSMTVPKTSNLAELKLWATTNNVKYQENYEFSTKYKQGEIIKIEPNVGSELSEDDTLIVTVSNGVETKIPYVVGMGKTAIQEKCNSLKLNCTFVYGGYTESTKKDIAIKQSKSSGTSVAEGSNLTITLSSGTYTKVNVPSFVGKTKNQITSSCKSLGITCKFVYNSSYTDQKKDTALKQDKSGSMYQGSTVTITLSKGPANSCTFTITEDLVISAYSNANALADSIKQKIKDKCPDVDAKFNYIFVKVDSGAGNFCVPERNDNCSPYSDLKIGSNTIVSGKTYKVVITQY